MNVEIEILAGAIIAFSIFIHAMVKLDKAYQTQSWPYVEGRIIYSAIRDDLVWETEQQGLRFTFEIKTEYKALIRYSYVVGGREYIAERISMGAMHKYSGSGAKTSALKIAKRYPFGSTVEVHYNPNNPTDAVLVTDPHWSVWLELCVGIVALGTIALIVLL